MEEIVVIDTASIILNLLIVISWVMYSLFEGYRESFYYHVTMLLGLKQPNIHWIYLIQRLIVLSVMAYLWHSIETISLYIGLVCIFSFFHDGMYYVGRNKLLPNIYPLGWKSSSTTSSAFFELNYTKRRILLIVGVVFIGLSFIRLTNYEQAI